MPVFAPSEPFKHLILTGRNGSGKTTVLRAIADVVRHDTSNGRNSAIIVAEAKNQLATDAQPQSMVNHYQQQINALGKVIIDYSGNSINATQRLIQAKPQTVIAFFEATRKVQVQEVTTVTKETDLAAQLVQSPASPASLFKQYLVNKKSSRFLKSWKAMKRSPNRKGISSPN